MGSFPSLGILVHRSQLHATVSVLWPEMPGLLLLLVQHANSVVCRAGLCVCVPQKLNLFTC